MIEGALIMPFIIVLATVIINVTLGYYSAVCKQAEEYQSRRYQQYNEGRVNNEECEFARRADLFID